MRVFVHSTLTNSYNYTNWTRPEPTMRPEIIHQVLIQGGANLATSPESQRGRNTPKVITTEITEADWEHLQQNTTFQKHFKQGLVVVTFDDVAGEKVAKDMTPEDKSAPLTPNSPIFQRGDVDGAVKPMSTFDKLKERVFSSPT